MSVCAILINYLGAHEIAGAVQSVLADAPDVQVVVVDNSEDDIEWALLETLLPPSVRRIRSPGNIGFGQGCNLALQHVDAPYIFLVNPDVRLLPGCTHALLDTLADHSNCSAVAPRQFLDANCQWFLPQSWQPTSVRAWVTERALREVAVARRVSRAARSEHLRFWKATSPVCQRALSGGVVMVRRNALRPGELLFDPRFFMYFEDSDLCMRLRRRGTDLLVAPQAGAVHAWQNLPHKAPLMEQSAQLFFEKYYASDNVFLCKSRLLAANAAQRESFLFEPVHSSVIHVPALWQDGWLLELSPTPLIQPAVGMFGAGHEAFVSAEIFQRFAGAAVFGRLSSKASRGIDEALLFCWR